MHDPVFFWILVGLVAAAALLFAYLIHRDAKLDRDWSESRETTSRQVSLSEQPSPSSTQASPGHFRNEEPT